MRFLVSVLFLSLFLISNLFSSGLSWAQAGVCAPSATTACLQQGAFEVSVSFDAAGAAFIPVVAGVPSGSAEFVDDIGDDAAVFEFYDDDQYDALVRVIDGCPINNRYWVFVAGATDAETEITVTESATSNTRIYSSPAGQPFQSVLDTTAFDTCDPLPTRQAYAADPGAGDTEVRGSASCGSTFCFQGERFGLDIAYEDAQGDTGTAVAVVSRDHSAVGAFFRSSSPAVVSSVLDGRNDNNAFWFLSGVTTNLALTYTLTDTQTGLVNVYVDPLGPATSIADRGQPVEANLLGMPSGDFVGFELVLTNTAPAERTFRATMPIPAGASNLNFTCTAAAESVCPNESGSGALDESGPIAAGGMLTYSILLDPAAGRGLDAAIEAEATVETAAHALADAQTRIVTASQLPAAAPVPVPVDAVWMLVVLASVLMSVMAFMTFAQRH